MCNAEEDEYSHFKLAQLWHFVNGTSSNNRKTYLHSRVVNEILKDDFNINYKVTIHLNRRKKAYKENLRDCTALHFLYYEVRDIDTFTTLIERGADFTAKNGNGQTVLHSILTESCSNSIRHGTPFIDKVLSAHLKFKNSVNPRDSNGFTHLHAACIINHAEAAELFLENGALFDEAVKLDAPQFAGYTPLHFAAEFHSFQVAQMLISRGANVNSRTVRGVSPLDLVVARRQGGDSKKNQEQFLKQLLADGAVSGVGLSSLHIAFELTDLTIAESLIDQSADINYVVPMTSPVRPGNNALHFAAHNSIEAVKMLVTRGAQLNVANDYGSTPLDYIMNRYNLQEIRDIFSCIESLKGMCLSDGETRLLDLIPVMRNFEQFKLLVQNKTNAVVPSDSVVWPGCTLLHLAVAFSEKFQYDGERFGKSDDKIILEECLRYGLSVNAQNSKRQTPIHLAFSEGKIKIVRLFLQHYEQDDQYLDFIDEDNLSYLHIACALQDESLVERLLVNYQPNVAYNGRRINIIIHNQSIDSGETPLHVAVKKGSVNIVETLLRHGAHLHAVDAYGMTPIHGLLNHLSNQRLANVMFTSLLVNPEDRVVSRLRLSYLHVACLFRNIEATEKLLNIGSDVNAIITCNEHSNNFLLNRYPICLDQILNFTPLQMAITHGNLNDEILDLLFRRGADLLANGSNKSSRILSYIPIDLHRVVRRFFQVLWDQDDMQKCFEEKCGLTKLHIACFMKDEERIRTVLTDGTNINVQVNVDSEIFAGCTPLHLLMTMSPTDAFTHYDFEPEYTVEPTVRLLLDEGADVTITNANKDTPIHVFCKRQMNFHDYDLCMDLLLSAQKNFSINPTNAEGESHFHIACRWNKVHIVEKFLQHCLAAVNRPIDYFVGCYSGSTPLHLALSHNIGPDGNWTNLLQTVELLLEHGADIAAKDVNGDTPLHRPAVLHSPGVGVLQKLLRHGGDINSTNIRGQNPLEVWPDNDRFYNNLSDYVKILQKYDYKINSWNTLTGEGYIAKIFLSYQEKLCESPEFKKFTESLELKAVDNEGRTAIHNSVAVFKKLNDGDIENNIYAIECFIKTGIDIDRQDESGQTALHYAARMENLAGVEALLACGADVNIIDENGKSAFSYAMEHSESKWESRSRSSPNVTVAIRLHVKKLEYLGTEVSPCNQNLLKLVERSLYGNYHKLSQNFFSQIEMTKTLAIGMNSLTLFNFLCETGAITLYSILPKSKQHLVDGFFESIDYADLEEVSAIIKLQFKKMKLRLELIETALSSLRILLGFSVPDLCEQISRYLLNTDLKNVIQSTTSKSRKRKRCISATN